MGWLITALLLPLSGSANDFVFTPCGTYVSCNIPADELTRIVNERNQHIVETLKPGESAGGKSVEALPTDDKGGEVKNEQYTPTGNMSGSIAPSSSGTDPNSFSSMKDIDKTGKGNATDAATDGYKKSSVLGGDSRYESGLADSLAKQYDQVRSYITLRESSNDPSAKKEAQSRLAESVTPPKDFEKIYGQLGIKTNRDVMDKAPTFVSKLADDSQALADSSARWKAASDSGAKAAEKIGDFQKEVTQRSADMSTLDSSAAKTMAAGAGGARAPASRAFSAGRASGATEDSIVTGGKEPNAEGSSANKGSTGAVSKAGDNTLDSAAAAAATAAQLGKLPAGSLREELRKRLAAKAAEAAAKAAASGKIAGTGGEGEGAFTPKVGALDAQAPVATVEGGTAEQKFHFYGSDNDAAIAKLMGGFGGANSGGSASGGSATSDAVFGNADETIFQRMRHFLNRAQADKRVR